MSFTPQTGLPNVTDAEPAPSPPQLWTLDAALDRDDIPELCASFAEMVRLRRPVVVICDVTAVDRPRMAIVDALARLRLIAERLGSGIVLRGAGTHLRQLILLTGLTDVLPSELDRLLDLRRQAEQREQPRRVQELRGVQEVVQPGDAPVGDLQNL
jgi:anti-anti-sigma regulatory factor